MTSLKKSGDSGHRVGGGERRTDLGERRGKSWKKEEGDATREKDNRERTQKQRAK